MAGFRKLLILLSVLFLALLALVFSLNNQEPVSLDFLVFNTPSHGIAVWIILAFVLGALAGILITLLATVRASATRRQLQKRLARAERSLAHSRAENNRTI